MKAIAARLGCSEGRVMTIAIGLVFSLVTAAWGIPPVVRDRPRSSAVAAPARGTQTTTPLASTRRDQASAPVPDLASPVAPAEQPHALVPEPGPAAAELAPAPPLAASLPRPFGTVSLFAPVGSPGAPEGIAVGPDGTVYVATNNAKGRGRPGPSKVLHYDERGELLGAVAITGQPADRKVGLTGLAVQPDKSVVVADGSTGRLIRVDGGGAQRTVATLFDLPPCNAVTSAPVCEPGSVDHPPLPRGVVADSAGTLYVTDAGQSTIWRVDATGLPLPLHSDARYTGAKALGGIAINAAGQVVFAAGSIYALPVDMLGRAGARTTFAAIPESDGARALAIAGDGRVYVTLAKTNRILVLDRHGAAAGRVASAHDASVPLDVPAGIAIAGRRLLVSNQSTGDPAHWAVLTVTF